MVEENSALLILQGIAREVKLRKEQEAMLRFSNYVFKDADFFISSDVALKSRHGSF